MDAPKWKPYLFAPILVTIYRSDRGRMRYVPSGILGNSKDPSL